MDWDDARQACYTRVANNWTAHPTVTILRAGETLPDLEGRTTPFIVIKAQPVRAQQAGMAGTSPPKRYYGRFEACLFVPGASGDLIVNQVLTTLDNLFTATSFSGIVCHGSHMPPASEAVGWRSQEFFSQFDFVKF